MAATAASSASSSSVGNEFSGNDEFASMLVSYEVHACLSPEFATVFADGKQLLIRQVDFVPLKPKLEAFVDGTSDDLATGDVTLLLRHRLFTHGLLCKQFAKPFVQPGVVVTAEPPVFNLQRIEWLALFKVLTTTFHVPPKDAPEIGELRLLVQSLGAMSQGKRSAYDFTSALPHLNPSGGELEANPASATTQTLSNDVKLSEPVSYQDFKRLVLQHYVMALADFLETLVNVEDSACFVRNFLQCFLPLLRFCIMQHQDVEFFDIHDDDQCSRERCEFYLRHLLCNESVSIRFENPMKSLRDLFAPDNVTDPKQYEAIASANIKKYLAALEKTAKRLPLDVEKLAKDMLFFHHPCFKNNAPICLRFHHAPPSAPEQPHSCIGLEQCFLLPVSYLQQASSTMPAPSPPPGPAGINMSSMMLLPSPPTLPSNLVPSSSPSAFGTGNGKHELGDILAPSPPTPGTLFLLSSSFFFFFFLLTWMVCSGGICGNGAGSLSFQRDGASGAVVGGVRTPVALCHVPWR